MRQRTVKYTPQQIRVAKRMNKILINKAKCILVNSSLAKGFWAKALCTASYLINRSPSSFVKFKTPQELWTRKPPNLTHIRMFGCVAYAHKIEGKLVPRDIRCVMLGYSKGVKGYRLWVLGKHCINIINSRNACV